jgi:hypothetical protein
VVRLAGQGFALGSETGRLATERGLPSMLLQKRDVEAGGLMSYFADHRELWRRIAAHVDRLLKGASPRELPFELPTRFELFINLKTAGASVRITSGVIPAIGFGPLSERVVTPRCIKPNMSDVCKNGISDINGDDIPGRDAGLKRSLRNVMDISLERCVIDSAVFRSRDVDGQRQGFQLALEEDRFNNLHCDVLRAPLLATAIVIFDFVVLKSSCLPSPPSI